MKDGVYFVCSFNAIAFYLDIAGKLPLMCRVAADSETDSRRYDCKGGVLNVPLLYINFDSLYKYPILLKIWTTVDRDFTRVSVPTSTAAELDR